MLNYLISIWIQILLFGFEYPISANSIPVQLFCYFILDFGSGFLVGFGTNPFGRVRTRSGFGIKLNAHVYQIYIIFLLF